MVMLIWSKHPTRKIRVKIQGHQDNQGNQGNLANPSNPATQAKAAEKAEVCRQMAPRTRGRLKAHPRSLKSNNS